MRVFLTGSTGWVGSAVAEELKGAGHTVIGLARSDASAAALERAGVAVHRGSLEDVESLRAGAAAADAVIHTAFNHDFSRFADNAEVERRAIAALAAPLEGSARPLIVTSGMALIAPGRIVTEDDVRDATSVPFPRDPETVAAAAASRGVRVSVVRLPPSVHGAGEQHGFLPRVIAAAREHGASAYIADGSNRWSGVHRQDAARVFRLALERAADRAIYHASADEGVPFRDIAATIARRLHVPVVSKDGADVDAHFGWFARFAAIDAPASSAKTRRTLGWHPTHPSLLDDLEDDSYYVSRAA
ncbi:MAG TPA: SDR family oxidoreductase [Candidatus Baltobacteraceae bacterium]|nr:SDR family oxidoreductase [Candidatus Baltobacteraceae bacterium]